MQQYNVTQRAKNYITRRTFTKWVPENIKQDQIANGITLEIGLSEEEVCVRKGKRTIRSLEGKVFGR